MGSFWLMNDGSIRELDALRSAAINAGHDSGAISGPYVTADEASQALQAINTKDVPQHWLHHPVSVVAFAIILTVIVVEFRYRAFHIERSYL